MARYFFRARNSLEALERVNRTPCFLISIHLAPAHLGDMSKAFGEGSIHERQYRSGWNGSDRRLHHPCARRSRNEDRSLGQKYGLQSALNSREQVLEFLAPMRNHRLEHCGKHFLPDLGRARQKECSKTGFFRHAATYLVQWQFQTALSFRGPCFPGLFIETDRELIAVSHKRHFEQQRFFGELEEPAFIRHPCVPETQILKFARPGIDECTNPEFLSESLQLSQGSCTLVQIHEVRLYPALGKKA